MPILSYDGQAYSLNEEESVLECLLRNKVDYPHSCKSGTCQSCLSRTKQVIDPAWQVGLQTTLKANGYFLPCIARPTTDIEILLPDTEEGSVTATITAVFNFNHNVIGVRLVVAELPSWIAGRYINLVNSDGDIRSYSIANLPEQDGYIELHIKLMPDGSMSNWLSKCDRIGTEVHIRGPIGNCFYCNPDHEHYPIVLAGTGTGVAPLIGIARDAMTQKHNGEIYLLHGGVTDQDLYLGDQLNALEQQHPNFHYKKCTLEKSDIHPSMSIETLLLETLKQLTRPRVFICGPEVLTKKLKISAFLSGVSSKDIYSDAFIIKSKLN